MPFERCRIVTYVDSDDHAILNAVEKRLKELPFAAIVSHFSAWAPPGEFATGTTRRMRHAAMRCASVGLVPDTKYLLLLEDDTTVPENTWERLSDAVDNHGYDWVSGFETGRWGCQCPGIWRVQAGKRVYTPTPSDGLEDCDATGIYLVLTTPEVYRSKPWDVWDNTYGHDVSIVYDMKRDGRRIGVDWSLECVHMTEKGDLYCKDWVALSRKITGFNPILMSHPNLEPLTEFQPTGPRRRLPSPRGKALPVNEPAPLPRRKHYQLGVDVTFNGQLYPMGCRIPYELLVAMSEAGVVQAKVGV